MADDDVPESAPAGGHRSRVVMQALLAGASGAFVVQATGSHRD